MTAPAPKKAKAPGPKEAAAKSAREAKAATPPAAKKAAPPAKAPKAAKAPKEGGVVRTQSTVSKEGNQKCAFSGETLPVTAFPTVRQSDGSYVRGTVARKHLQAYRDQRKAEREAAKAAAAQAKADKAAATKAKDAAPAK